MGGELTWLVVPKEEAIDPKDSSCPVRSHTLREVQSFSDEDTVGRKVEGTAQTTEVTQYL